MNSSVNFLFIAVLTAVLCVSGTLALCDIKLTRDEKNLIEQGEVIVRELSSKDKKGKTVEAVGLIEATVDEVYRVLIKFEDYSTFMPHVSDVEIVQRDDSHAILNYALSLPLGKTKRYRLSKTYKYDGNTASMQWDLIDWPELKKSETIKNTTGYWLVKYYPEKKGYVIAVYHVYTDPGPIPLGLGWIADILSKNSVPEVVIKTREQVVKTRHKDTKGPGLQEF
ncbi:MAG: hypothetical protein JXB48_03475 [Candidatus Latescibacteria bacterium]|nr:hypothetical protein [Candidatus Latescibacterota bacterium]